MTGALPSTLLVDVRFAYRLCAQQHRRNTHKQFSSISSSYFENRAPRCFPRTTDNQLNKLDNKTATSPDAKSETPVGQNVDWPPVVLESKQQSNELVRQSQGGRSVEKRRTVNAPLKIIPKADVAPNLRLSPRERLHIEILTRRGPPQIKQTKTYKERLLIYHHGNLTNNALVWQKVLALFGAALVSGVIVPAHYFAGTPMWICGSLLLAGWFPAIFLHHLLKPLVARVYLRLPPNARASPETAMKYAKNLPASAQVDIDFTRITALPGTVSINVADLQPVQRAKRWSWNLANIRWVGSSVDKGSLFRRNPAEFYVRPEVGAGRARRDVIPGIWQEVYKRLVGATTQQPSKWKQSQYQT